MRYFPVFLDLAHKRVVVVGGGEEALRKVRLLLKTEARIEVIAPALCADLEAESRVVWVSDVFLGDMLDGAALVFSADADLNDLVSAEAQLRGIAVNAVDEAAISTFIVPSIVDRDPVVVAIGTEGAAPVLAQGLRAKIDALLPGNLGALTRRAAGLREIAASQVPAGNARRSFWHDFFFGSIAEAHKAGDDVAYELALGDTLFNHAQGGKGRLSLIVPPADPELLTLKAQRRLMEADVIVATDSGASALLEMARRDAVRSSDVEQAIALASLGRNVVVIAQQAPAILRRAETLAIAVEILSLGQNAPTSPFPVHEDLGDAILRAAL